MTTYIKSINRNVWKVVETKIEIANEEAPTTAEEMLLQNNDIALSAIHDALDERIFYQIKNKLMMMHVIRNMIMKTKVIVMMMNQLRMNYLTC